jgi:hypothetical protein
MLKPLHCTRSPEATVNVSPSEPIRCPLVCDRPESLLLEVDVLDLEVPVDEVAVGGHSARASVGANYWLDYSRFKFSRPIKNGARRTSFAFCCLKLLNLCLIIG